MGRSITAEAGKVVSWGSSNETDAWFNSSTGILKDNRISVEYVADNLDTTGRDDTAARAISGLRSANGTIDALYPRAAPRIGVQGLVTHATGYVHRVASWELLVEADPQELDITALNQANQTWRTFRPGSRIRWSGSYRSRVDSAASLALPGNQTNGASAAIALKILEDGAADPSFTGNAIITRINDPIDIGGGGLVETEVQFAGDGALTSVAGSTLANLFPAGAIAPPSWDANADGEPDNTLVYQLASGLTRTGPAHWTSVRVSVPADGLITVSISVRFGGPVT